MLIFRTVQIFLNFCHLLRGLSITFVLNFEGYVKEANNYAYYNYALRLLLLYRHKIKKLLFLTLLETCQALLRTLFAKRLCPLVNIAGYTVLERSLISKVLEENKFQTSGLVDDFQISEMGMRMGQIMFLL